MPIKRVTARSSHVAVTFAVRPLKMDLDGVVGHVVQGTKILLQCTVRAARPPANVTWQNGTQFLSESNERFEMFETKVHENVSKRHDIAFTSDAGEAVTSAPVQLVSLSPFKRMLLHIRYATVAIPFTLVTHTFI